MHRQMAKQTNSWMLVLLHAFTLTLEFLMLEVYQHQPFAVFVEAEIEINVKYTTLFNMKCLN